MEINNSIKVLGFAGKAGVGKSTVAREVCGLLLKKKYAEEPFRGIRKAETLSFAGPLKKMVEALYKDCDRRKDEAVYKGKTIREIFQTLGTEWGRDIVGEDFWIHNALYAKYNEFSDDEAAKAGSCIVIEDVRFPNEVEAIRNLGGSVFYLMREKHETIEQSQHASENNLSPGSEGVLRLTNYENAVTKTATEALRRYGEDV